MNFKTTLLLLVALVIVGTFVLFRGRPSDDTSPPSVTRKLLPIESFAVSEISVTNSDGSVMTITKGNAGEWRLTKPVAAAAERFAVDDLVRAVTSLESTSQVDVTPATGLENPRYTVSIIADGKTHEVQIGDPSAVGENLYVKLPSETKADVVAGSQLVAQLAKPVKDYRKTQLTNATVEQFHSVTITREGQPLSLAKVDGVWTITGPTTMPADAAAVNDVLYGVTGLRAEDFVSESFDAAAVGRPQVRISYTTSGTAVTTQAAKTIIIGQPSDIGRKSLLATSPDLAAVVKIPATAIDAFNKTALDLRDKQVLSLDAMKIDRIDLTSDRAATTQPATRPAAKSNITLTRAPEPTTLPATTQATTLPQLPMWLLNDKPANDHAVDTLLNAFASFRTEKFVNDPPTVAKPLAVYTLSFTMRDDAGRHEIRIVDLGNDGTIYGSYNGLSFELQRSLLSTLSASFEAPAN